MFSLRQRVSAASVGLVLAVGGLGGVAIADLTATAASAAGASLTHNDNACTTSAQPNSPSLIAVGLTADQSDPGLANTVDSTSGATVPAGTNVTVANIATLTPTHNLLQGTSSALTGTEGELFVSAAFVQAGVGLGIVTIGQTITADVSATIDATNATFPSSGQPAGVTVNSPTQVTLSGTGNASGTVVGSGGIVTAPVDAVGPLPNPNYSVPNTPNVVAAFYQDSTPPAAPNIYPGDGSGATTDSSAHILAHVGTLNVPLGCEPGESPSPQTTPATWTQTAQSAVYVFADVLVSPALPPTLVPQTVPSVNLGGQAIIHAGAGATDNVPITSYAVATQPAHGTAAINASTGDVTYTNDGTGAGGPDSFTVTATSSGGTSAPVTETISNILANPPSCDATSPGPSCQLKQIIVVPVTGADLTMSQISGLPNDVLNHTLVGGACTGAAITLNGQPQFACGAMFPVTVVNARGTDSGWTLSGQVTDFLDPNAPSTLTCDTPATYNNHCIPGGNLSWDPVAAVSHVIVPGDTAAIAPGTPVLGGLATVPPSLANAAGLTDSLGQNNPALAAFGDATQGNPVVEPNPVPGLHDAAQTLCTTASGHSGGTFICGAGLVVAVPASAAAPAAPGYQATLTLTLA